MVAKKICLLGSFAVGKTSLVARYVRSIYSDEYHTTVGVKVDKKIVEVGEKKVKLMIWDIAGKDDFFTPPGSYFKGLGGFLLVIDGTRLATVKVAEELLERVTEVNGKIPCFLMLNKCDLQNEWEVEEEHLKVFADQGIPMFKTSAKTGELVEDVFTGLATKMVAD